MQILKLSSKIDPDGHLRLDLPTQLSECSIELVMVINPVRKAHRRQRLSVQEETRVRKYDFSDLAGKLTWRGDALAIQRSLRDEW